MIKDGLFREIETLGAIFYFELKKQVNKFFLLSMVSLLYVISLSFIPYILFAEYALPDTFVMFFREGYQYLNYIIIFAACLFFGGIICEEFDYKTGYLTFPVMNRYKLIFGKFLCNISLIFGIIVVFYLTLGIVGVYFFGEGVPIEYFGSLLMALLYTLAVCSVLMFLSSVMKNVTMTMVSGLMLLLIASSIINMLGTMLFSDIEPLYSLEYSENLISYILDFPEERYMEMKRGEFTRVTWLTPTVEAGVTVMILYSVIFISLSMIIFRKRQLK